MLRYVPTRGRAVRSDWRADTNLTYNRSAAGPVTRAPTLRRSPGSSAGSFQTVHHRWFRASGASCGAVAVNGKSGRAATAATAQRLGALEVDRDIEPSALGTGLSPAEPHGWESVRR